MGTTSGEPREVERFDDSYVSKDLDRIGPEFLARYPCHVIAAHVASELNFAGANTMIPTACAAGNYAIAHALDVMRDLNLQQVPVAGLAKENEELFVKDMTEPIVLYTLNTEVRTPT